MLVSLGIRNYALIDKLSIDFGSGLNALTGETGAGKSIIIGALSLALGGRASADSARDPSVKITVQALFQIEKIKPVLSSLLEESSIDCEDGEILITREITPAGKSVCKINDIMVSVSTLKLISAELIDIHGQHEHQKLLSQQTHIDFLDMYASFCIQNSLQEVASAFYEMKESKKAYENALSSAKTERDKLDEYKRVYEQIVSLKLKAGEDAELEQRLKILTNGEKLYELIDGAYSCLYRSENSVSDSLYKAVNNLDTAVAIDPSVGSIAEGLNDAAIAVDELLIQMRDYKENLEFDPRAIDEIQLRLEKINSLKKKKYGSDVSEILDYAETLKKSISLIVNFDEEIAALKNRYEADSLTYYSCADKLSCLRKNAAEGLRESLKENLQALSMPNAEIKIDFSPSPPSEKGTDSVSFLFSANLGQEPKPLSKIASGGEISRVMLAIKAILADADEIETMIFDEIDTGISGRTAQNVAEKMCDIAKSHQVICITHLPQLAGMADSHFLIEKRTQEGKTFTGFRLLEQTERTTEMARMLGGVSVTETTLSHASEMLKLASEYKNK